MSLESFRFADGCRGRGLWISKLLGLLIINFKGPSTQYLGTWDLGNSSSITGFGQVYGYWVLGP